MFLVKYQRDIDIPIISQPIVAETALAAGKKFLLRHVSDNTWLDDMILSVKTVDGLKEYGILSVKKV